MAERKSIILIVDDDRRVGLTIQRWIKHSGKYEVILAEDGVAGLKAAKREIPDLILLDINMPKMNGLEVLKRLRDDEATSMIPVVMITSVDDGEAIRTAMHEHAEQYIMKPVDQDVLESTIERILSRRG